MADLIPIPDLEDLNIKTYTICWPDSDEFEGLLTGFISMPAAEGFWDPATGDLAAALAVGDQLLGLNAGIAEREVSDMTCLIPVGAEPLLISEFRLILSAGTETELITPPAGETWLITRIGSRNSTSAMTAARINLVANGQTQWLEAFTAPSANQILAYDGVIPINEDGQIQLVWVGVNVSDQLRWHITGWKWTA